MTELDYKNKVLQTDNCWLWLGSHDVKGYGRAWFKGRQYKAHRAIYEIEVGVIDAGLELDHLCRNRGCVNPKHLEPVTHQENVKRGNSGIIQKAQTHCKWGHEFTEENTYIKKVNGIRDCKTCRKRRNDEYRARTQSWNNTAMGWDKEFSS